MGEPWPSVSLAAVVVPSPEVLVVGSGEVVESVGLVGTAVVVVDGGTVVAAPLVAAEDAAGLLPGVVLGLVPDGLGVLPDVARGGGGVLLLEELGFGDGLGDGLGAGAGAGGGAELGARPLPKAKPMTVPGAGL